jgi:hypothetical protein
VEVDVAVFAVLGVDVSGKAQNWKCPSEAYARQEEAMLGYLFRKASGINITYQPPQTRITHNLFDSEPRFIPAAPPTPVFPCL